MRPTAFTVLCHGIEAALADGTPQPGR